MVAPEYMPDGTNTPEEELTPQDILSERPPRPFTKEHTQIGHTELRPEIVSSEPPPVNSDLLKKETPIPEGKTSGISKEYNPDKHDKYTQIIEGHFLVLIDPDTEEEVARVPRILQGSAPDEDLKILDRFGREQTIKIDEDPVGKYKIVNDLLTAIEQSGTPGGPPGLDRVKENTEAILIALRSHPDFLARHAAPTDPNYEIGDKLLREYLARLRLHQTYFDFLPSGTPQEAAGKLKNIQASDWNFFFRKPEFVHAIQYFEDNAERFLGLVNIDKPGFRVEMTNYLISNYGGDVDSWLSLQTSAERIYEMSFRLAAKDTLKNDQSGWKSEISGLSLPTIVAKGIVNFKNNIIAGAEVNHFFPQLTEGVDIGGRDFLTYAAHNNLPNYVDNPTLSTEENVRRKKIVDDDKTSQLEVWKAGGKIDFESIDWNNFDFSRFGLSPTSNSGWDYVNILKPEQARDAMMKDANSLLRNPNKDSLAGLIDAFNYPGVNRWEIKKRLLLNYIDFTRDRYSKTGKQDYSLTRIKADVNELMGVNDPNKPEFIRFEQSEGQKKDGKPSDRKEVLAELDQISKNRNLIAYIYEKGVVKGSLSFVTSFILSLLKYIFQQSTKN